LLPVIPYSENDIQSRRENLIEAVRALKKQNLIVENPPVNVGTTNFYLAYHSQNNRTLLEDIAKLHIAACPKLTYEAKHCRFKKGEQKDRLRIGFLSSFFWNHTVGKLSRGIIEHFSRDHFDVIVFRLPGKKDEISEVIDQAADKVVPLYRKLDRDWKIIAEEELDILFYLDIGMDPYTYFLSFARLAPVQAVSWGHPDTTGIPNIDYFISSDLLEDPCTSRQYTEQLVQLSVLPTYYFPPKLPEKTFDRAEFGLPDEGSLYVCPQSLFKLHPEFDKVIGDLLRHDPVGRLVLIDDDKGGHWNNLIIERIGRSCPDIVDRVKFVPRMPNEKFLGLLILADALLDVPTFSGGNSSLEAFAMAAPIVTLPGNFMRSRTTAGCYKQMGLSDLIASDADSYVSLALKLAHDADFRSRMQTDIKENSHKLFERIEVVQEMEAFFIQAYNSFQKDEVLTDAGFNRPKVSIQQIPLSQ
jgi:predicted O-linked N-acetylglucosamine transferase (SPINDLY family)